MADKLCIRKDDETAQLLSEIGEFLGTDSPTKIIRNALRYYRKSFDKQVSLELSVSKQEKISTEEKETSQSETIDNLAQTVLMLAQMLQSEKENSK